MGSRMTHEDHLASLVAPTKTQVFLLTCPAHLPFSFARHPWFVINKKGVLSRWEVVYGNCRHVGTPLRAGHIHIDALPPFRGISIFHSPEILFWNGRCEAVAEGELAENLISFIEASKDTYPYRDRYLLWGPNSNTYAQWVLDAFPTWNAKLPWNAFSKNYMKRPTAVGVVHGRFQPPHSGHIRYILSALERAQHLIIGICTPAICTEEESARTGYPCTPALNPFTHDERADMIRAALDEAGISHDRYSFTAFPSDYKNIKDLLPKGTVFFMSVTGAGDTRKTSYIERLGFRTETLIQIPEESARERSGLVRELGKTADPAWEHQVPKSIAAYMKEHGLLDRLK